MMTCKELTELVTDYLEGRMSLWQRLQFQLHLGMCGHCRAYVRQMRVTIRTVGRVPQESVPPSVRDELLRRFASMRPPASGQVRRD
jgi:predicted anti-sigma-YlaC factor YlaD